MGEYPENKKARRQAGGQSMIVGFLDDQSRHRAAMSDPRHQRWTAEAAAMAFRFIIKRLVGEAPRRGQAIAPNASRHRAARVMDLANLKGPQRESALREYGNQRVRAHV